MVRQSRYPINASSPSASLEAIGRLPINVFEPGVINPLLLPMANGDKSVSFGAGVEGVVSSVITAHRQTHTRPSYQPQVTDLASVFRRIK